MSVGVDGWSVLLSLSLIGVAVALSLWRRLDVEGSILWAAARAAIQLLAVGVLLTVIFESSRAWVWSWIWIGVMVTVAIETVRYRARAIPSARPIAAAALGVATAVGLALIFLPDVIPADPPAFVVIAGITLGNTLPSAVLALDRLSAFARERYQEIEGMLSLGFDQRGATRFLVSSVARTALIPQIERTKVVGLIALPGAMTGLLLAGVDAFDAVLVQLVIMYVILGSVATSVSIVTILGARQVFTPDIRMAEWTRQPAPTPGSGSLRSRFRKR